MCEHCTPEQCRAECGCSQGECFAHDKSNQILPTAEPALEAAKPAELNEFGCVCGPEDLCNLCSEEIDVEYLTDEDGGEEKHYPHISQFQYPLTPAETVATFRNFISRVSR